MSSMGPGLDAACTTAPRLRSANRTYCAAGCSDGPVAASAPFSNMPGCCSPPPRHPPMVSATVFSAAGCIVLAWVWNCAHGHMPVRVIPIGTGAASRSLSGLECKTVAGCLGQCQVPTLQLNPAPPEYTQSTVTDTNELATWYTYATACIRRRHSLHARRRSNASSFCLHAKAHNLRLTSITGHFTSAAFFFSRAGFSLRMPDF